MQQPEALNDYSVVVPITVAWGEMDSFQHVNNIIYFRYFETARMEYFERSGLNERLKKTGVGPILAKTSCRFKSALTYPDKIWVGVRIESLQKDRLTHAYQIFSESQNRIAAYGEGEIVAFDYRKNEKSLFPDEQIKQFEKIEQKSFPL